MILEKSRSSEAEKRRIMAAGPHAESVIQSQKLAHTGTHDLDGVSRVW